MRRVPHIGDIVYSVHESIAGETAWKRSGEPFHYVVTEGQVLDIIKGGYMQAKVKNYLNGEYMCLSFPGFADFGKSYFWSLEEACQLAEKVTDDYERRWRGMLKGPLKRPWRETNERHDR